jgi:phosphoribosyl 1,2-cyclic phosphate phosphodiesterase
MRVEILGSGGATTTPRPGCRCRVCVEARERGVPYARTGPSVFVHGPDILFDTPEESKLQIDRAGIEHIGACFYSHWHPDHTMGRRMFETRNGDFLTWPAEDKHPLVTDVYLPQQVALDFGVQLGARAHLAFMEERGWIRVHELRDGDTVEIAGVAVRPFRLTEDYVYAFELSGRGKRILVAMDELNGWVPPGDVRGCDLAVIPRGIDEHDPFTGARRIAADHPILRYEATFAETLEIVDRLRAKRVVMSHVEEVDALSFDDLVRLEGTVGRGIVFAYDGLVIDV